jgi:hypothetical protein
VKFENWTFAHLFFKGESKRIVCAYEQRRKQENGCVIVFSQQQRGVD